MQQRQSAIVKQADPVDAVLLAEAIFETLTAPELYPAVEQNLLHHAFRKAPVLYHDCCSLK